MQQEIMSIPERKFQMLARLANYIMDNVGSQDWQAHIDSCASYVAAMLELNEYTVTTALKQYVGIGGK